MLKPTTATAPAMARQGGHGVRGAYAGGPRSKLALG